VGRRGEDLVSEFLRGQSFVIIKRNWRTPFGEIDVVASCDSTLHIFEIKTRTALGRAELTGIISPAQRSRLKRAATWIWLRERRRFANFRCHLVVVTGDEIKTVNLPLLYDNA
jgi:putative endonuclease